MSSTYFEPEVSSVRRLYIQLWYSVFDLRQYQHFYTYQTAYTDELKTYHTITVYINIFLKMNLRVRNM